MISFWQNQSWEKTVMDTIEETMKTGQIIRTTNWIGKTNSWLMMKASEYRARSLYLPAGETPKALYAQWTGYPHPALNELTLYQLDEIISGEKSGMFAWFFRKHLSGWKICPP